MSKEYYRKIPSVNRIISSKHLAVYLQELQPEILKRLVNSRLQQIRSNITGGGEVPEEEQIIRNVSEFIKELLQPSLKPVINATGVILHTNLGRAPLGEEGLMNIKSVAQGYCNLEYDLVKARRGSRNNHLARLLNLVLNCEDSVVVNNNAAALFLCLKTMAEGKEIIISRGELVEIGGSFRIPDIISACGAKLVEVGTTNKTKLRDYEKAVTENTALFLKVHKSNYYMHGFTDEVSIQDLVLSARKHELHTVFDLGTGLLDKSLYEGMEKEPDLKIALEQGADVVTISCDKLLGGPQAGIATGRKDLICRMADHPLMRILRVDKMTIAGLNYLLTSMLYSPAHIEKVNPVLRFINRDMREKVKLADLLVKRLACPELKLSVVDNKARCGGGTLPYHEIESKAVLVRPGVSQEKFGKTFAESIFSALLSADIPVLGILREGNLFFDVSTLESKDIEIIAENVRKIIADL